MKKFFTFRVLWFCVILSYKHQTQRARDDKYKNLDIVCPWAQSLGWGVCQGEDVKIEPVNKQKSDFITSNSYWMWSNLWIRMMINQNILSNMCSTLCRSICWSCVHLLWRLLYMTNIPRYVTNVPPYRTNIPSCMTNTSPCVTNIPQYMINVPPYVTNIPRYVTKHLTLHDKHITLCDKRRTVSWGQSKCRSTLHYTSTDTRDSWSLETWGHNILARCHGPLPSESVR